MGVELGAGARACGLGNDGEEQGEAQHREAHPISDEGREELAV